MFQRLAMRSTSSTTKCPCTRARRPRSAGCGGGEPLPRRHQGQAAQCRHGPASPPRASPSRRPSPDAEHPHARGRPHRRRSRSSPRPACVQARHASAGAGCGEHAGATPADAQTTGACADRTSTGAGVLDCPSPRPRIESRATRAPRPSADRGRPDRRPRKGGRKRDQSEARPARGRGCESSRARRRRQDRARADWGEPCGSRHAAGSKSSFDGPRQVQARTPDTERSGTTNRPQSSIGGIRRSYRFVRPYLRQTSLPTAWERQASATSYETPVSVCWWLRKSAAKWRTAICACSDHRCG